MHRKGAVIPKMEDIKNKERKEKNNKKVNQYHYDCGVSRYNLHYRLWEKSQKLQISGIQIRELKAYQRLETHKEELL